MYNILLRGCFSAGERVQELTPTPRSPPLVFKAHRLLHDSTLGLRLIKKKKESATRQSPPLRVCPGRFRVQGSASPLNHTPCQDTSVLKPHTRESTTRQSPPTNPHDKTKSTHLELRFTLTETPRKGLCPSIRLISTGGNYSYLWKSIDWSDREGWWSATLVPCQVWGLGFRIAGLIPSDIYILRCTHFRP